MKNKIIVTNEADGQLKKPTCAAIEIDCDTFHITAKSANIVVGFFSFDTQQKVVISHVRDGERDLCEMVLAAINKSGKDYLVQPHGGYFTEISFPDYLGWSFEGYNVGLYKQDSRNSGYCEIRFTLVKNPNRKYL
jgi:hypothetical protein